MSNLIWENIFKREKKARSIAHILSQNKLFSSLNEKELSFLEKIVHERHFRADEPIFRQGELGVGMYIIAKGAVDISVHDRDFVEKTESSNTKEILVTRLVAGDFFGELSLVEEGGKRSANATAAEDSTLIGFFKPDLIAVLQRNPTTGVKIVLSLAEIIGKRLRATTEKITQLRSEMKLLTEIQKKAKSEYHDDIPEN